MDHPFLAGDLVHLNRGPPMTTEGVFGDTAFCSWSEKGRRKAGRSRAARWR
jgi:hypothetical protein